MTNTIQTKKKQKQKEITGYLIDIPPKRRSTFNGLYGFVFQKMHIIT
jgi:hypothetical protein